MPNYQDYANFEWQSRWNRAHNHAISVTTTQSGPCLVASGFFGMLSCRLDNEDVPTIVRQARRFADHLENIKNEYDGIMKETTDGHT